MLNRVTAVMAQGGVVRARSGLSEAETEVEARARVYRATAGQRNWRLRLAGSNSGSGTRRRQSLRAQGTAAAEPRASGLRWGWGRI